MRIKINVHDLSEKTNEVLSNISSREKGKILRKMQKRINKKEASSRKRRNISESSFSTDFIIDQNVNRKSNLPLKPLNNSQKELINTINTKTLIIEFGPAGTGKTYISAAMAADMLSNKEINKIYITRPNVPCGESIGYFPGTLEEKMAPWVAPLTSVIKERIGSGPFEYALKHGYIEIIPFETMRGRSLENSFVILDEAQNVTWEEFKMFITRIGANSKVVVNGDIRQSDLKIESGLSKYIKLLQNNYEDLEEFVGVIEFSSDDIVRHELVKRHVKIFERDNL